MKAYPAAYVLKQARGFPHTEGYTVISKDFAQDLEEELERLYALEAEVKALLEAYGRTDGTAPTLATFANLLRPLVHPDDDLPKRMRAQ